ncbi:alcohol dehydrogenase catalytic domain-containing protein [Planosporangium thailandense]|uniref:alcohol dehydrogenase catalytic domain-containing protein n=1 Tax=Planosporangium thailandense TaxID=765197 RepID=UPI0023F800BF|nr:alcohol dehydrogenase catalytic domain-containing protein [Planosporangium thailandense]
MTHPAPTVTSGLGATAGPPCRRLLITAPGTVELIEQILPPLGDHDVYVRTVVSGISHGTELAWLHGAAAALHRTWHTGQRIYLDGPGRDYPVAPGYESIGRVTQVGPAVTAVAVGDLIAVDAPHADGHRLTDTAAAAGLLPAGVDPEQAVFFILTRVALGGVHDAALSVGDTAVVVGLGTVGLQAAQIARRAGARVIGVDRYPLRVEAAGSTKRSAAYASAAGSPPSPPTATRGHLGQDQADAGGTFLQRGQSEHLRCRSCCYPWSAVSQ